MGWITDDGRHEGYLVPLFFDGQRAAGVTSGRIPDGEIAVDIIYHDDGTDEYVTRPAGEVVGWVVECDCNNGSDSSRTSRWVGPTFQRVPSTSLADLDRMTLYAEDEDVAYVSEEEDVNAAALAVWRREHAGGLEALTYVELAFENTLSARDELTDAVRAARAHGASWEAIGRATSMTRQSAHERWG